VRIDFQPWPFYTFLRDTQHRKWFYFNMSFGFPYPTYVIVCQQLLVFCHCKETEDFLFAGPGPEYHSLYPPSGVKRRISSTLFYRVLWQTDSDNSCSNSSNQTWTGELSFQFQTSTDLFNIQRRYKLQYLCNLESSTESRYSLGCSNWFRSFITVAFWNLSAHGKG